MRRLILALVASVALACGVRALEPEAVRLDHVHCATCGMMISRLQDTAQAVFPDEDTRFYDDLGCLARDVAARRPGARLYARAADGNGWLDVEQSWFAAPAGRETPMGYGLAAFGDAEGARKADFQGRALRWENLRREEDRRP